MIGASCHAKVKNAARVSNYMDPITFCTGGGQVPFALGVGKTFFCNYMDPLTFCSGSGQVPFAVGVGRYLMR